MLKLPAARLDETRRRVLALFEVAFEVTDGSESMEVEQWVERALTAQLIELLSDPELDKDQEHTGSSGSFIVERCHRLTLAARENPPSVFDICQKLRVSRRTVQNSFRSVVETTPVNYIRSIRLNGVRRDLLGTRANELSIGDAAAHWGFFHLSHFAADYRALFGELPSRTSRADGRVSPQSCPMRA
jgi:AraC family transcriptional regulator, ethanolamine operon transcriptional activator